MAARRREPVWVDRLVVEGVHIDLLRTFGGRPGLRDEGALESALARPVHKWNYSKRVDLAALAAAYGYGLARNHPFVDGYKRIAFLVIAVFLGLNKKQLETSEEDVVTVMTNLAGGTLSETRLAGWIRSRIVTYRGN